MASIEDIVKQIVNKLRAEGKQVTKAIAHVVAETLHNPTTGMFYVEEVLDNEIAKIMIQKAVDIIKNTDDIMNKTLLLQTSKY